MTVGQHPKGLYTLSLGEAWDRFSFYGTRAILVLYLTKVMFFSDTAAYNFYGAFFALGFATPVLGGYLADKLIGPHKAILMGACMMILGNTLLSLSTHVGFILGLTLTSMGTGLYKPNITNLVGFLYAEGDRKRDRGHTIFYMAMNSGAIFGPIVYGFVALRFGWNAGFLTSALGIAFGFILYLCRRRLFSFPRKKKEKPILFALILALALIGVTAMYTYPHDSDGILASLIIFTVVWIFYQASQRKPQERNAIITIVVLSLFTVFFYICIMQMASSVLLFIQRDLPTVFAQWHIPLPLFNSFEPISIVILTPLVVLFWEFLDKRGIEPSFPTKVAIGLTSSGICFTIFTWLAFAQLHGTVPQHPMLWIILASSFLGIGELCITPIIFSAISRFAPSDLRGTLIGAYFMSMALSGFLGSLIDTMHSNVHQNVYFLTFRYTTILTLSMSVVAFLLAPQLQRTLSSKEIKR